MWSTNCNELQSMADSRAKEGMNLDAMDLFKRAADCWIRWESFSKAAKCYERAYEHGMLAQNYAEAANTMIDAAHAWIRIGEHEKFEIDCQIAAEGYILAAEKDKDPKHLLKGGFTAILGGDLDMAKHLIHAAAATTGARAKELINLALMLVEYQFGDADRYIEAAIARVLDKKGYEEIRQHFRLTFVGFLRTSLESEVALSLASLAESTGLDYNKVEKMVRKGIEKGLITAHLDETSKELVIDTDRADIADIRRRKRPILSSDLKDPGAWDRDTSDEGA